MATLMFCAAVCAAVAAALAAAAAAMAVSTCAFAFATAVFCWSTAPSSPGLFTRTVTLRLLGLSWVACAFAFAVALAFALALPPADVDACALAEALFDCAVPLPSPGWPTSTATFVFAGVVCVALASPWVAAALVVGSEVVLLGPALDGEAVLGVVLTSLDEFAAPSVGPAPFGLVAAGLAAVSFGFVADVLDVVVDVGASLFGAVSVAPAAVG